MLGLVHALLLWSDHTRQVGKRPTRPSTFVLALSVLAWSVVHQVKVFRSTAIYDSSDGWLRVCQRSLWPLTLIPVALSTIEFHAWVDGLLQNTRKRWVLLQTDVIDTTVQWQGVSVHVGLAASTFLCFRVPQQSAGSQHTKERYASSFEWSGFWLDLQADLTFCASLP